MSIIHLDPSMSIQECLNNLNPLEAHTIYLAEGIYREKIFLQNSNITFIGVSAYKTSIVFGDYSYKLHDDGLLFNTFRTSTLTVTGNYNKFINLTIENDAGHSDRIGQAISVSLYGDANQFTDCILKGNQDTLFIGPLPVDLVNRYAHILPLSMRHTNVYNHYFKSTTIIGNVDFIFGSGNGYFKDCNLIFNAAGYLAAPSTYENEIGLVFKNCTISNVSPDDNVVLARPWREFGTTVFYDCNFQCKISNERYSTWDKKHFKFYESPYFNHSLTLLLPIELKQKLDLEFSKF